MERIAQHTDKGSIIFPLNTDKLLILVCNRKFACQHTTKKVLTYDDEPFSGTCESNVYLVLISNEAEVLLAPTKSRVRLYPVIRE